MVDYLISHADAVKTLFKTYGKNASSADVIIGVMIRDATRFSQIIEYIFKQDLVYELFSVLVSDNFDVSTDAFQTLKDVLTNHNEISAPWLTRNFEKFFPECMKLLKPKDNGKTDYVTVRQMVALLSTIMLERPFMETMIQFVCHEEFLITTLVLLGNASKVVQYETFHLFKIFAANPRKPPKIAKLLNQNRERIMKILDQIEQDRLDDHEFKQDKNAVVAKLNALKQQQQQAAPRATPGK
jgi:calcium binding protein 39